MKAWLRKAWSALTHLVGRLSGRYYFEDYVRVYPDGLAYGRFGRPRAAGPDDLKNFLNHRKFYLFAAQFVRDAVVVDVGCGSGYGCAVLKEGGAARVLGVDASAQAVAFARERYGAAAEFSVQGITDLRACPDGLSDVTVASEVLEHIQEYGREDAALRELRRITRPGGLVVLGTPNRELLDGHGFAFEELDALLRRQFREYVIFENALVPFGPRRRLWEERRAAGRTGVVVTEAIALAETVLPAGERPELKSGRPAGTYRLGDLEIETRLLHNTHSWVVVARKSAAEPSASADAGALPLRPGAPGG